MAQEGKPHLWLREETKPGEKRCSLIPAHAAELVKEGYTITVERQASRCFEDEEYEKAGCTLIDGGEWEKPDGACPKDAIILGLKELPPLPRASVTSRKHIYFAHCYKGQDGWKEELERHVKGGGTILDFEFLVDENGRRVAAFGRAAGICGMGVGLLAWAAQKLGEPMPKLDFWTSKEAMCTAINVQLDKVQEKLGRRPRGIILGALGRCGRGATWVADQCGVETTKWDIFDGSMPQGGPFPVISDEHDLFLNAIYLTKKIPPFITDETLDAGKRQMSVIVDVSCDPNNANNPLPVYSECTTMFEPLLRIRKEDNAQGPLDVVAIDHLPSLIPSESSTNFSTAMLPHYKNFDADCWTRSVQTFNEKLEEAGFARQDT